MLEYIIQGFYPGGKPISNWPYNKEQTGAVYAFISQLVEAYSKILAVEPWYDVLGCIYESLAASKGRKQGFGQFFTPINVCNVMAALTVSNEPDSKNNRISDPCCGSGRLLLAEYAACVAAGAQDIRVTACDLDRTCCMMTTVNFIFHGVIATVYRGNSLTGDYNETWTVRRLGPIPYVSEIKKL